MGCMQGRPADGHDGFDENQPLSQKEIQARIVASDVPTTFSTDLVNLRYAYLSQRGYYPDSPDKANQDDFCIKTKFGGYKDRALFAVFDGHGTYGDHCAMFCADYLHIFLEKELEKEEKHNKSGTLDVKKALKAAFVKTNEQLHRNNRIRDDLSGTTCILVLIIGKVMHIANIGDSRAIVAKQDHANKEKLNAIALSYDQTPYRKDERERVKKAGARVLTMGQIEGSAPLHEDWGDLKLGDELDEDGDPPRVWSKTENYPGTAFTRSFGDSEAEKLGVYAEPEIDVRTITPNDQFVCIASDGVFEFLTNQAVVDIVKRYQDPLEANRVVVQEAYQAWLDLEVRTDDITMICVFLSGVSDANFDPTAAEEVSHLTPRSEGARPVRRQVSRKAAQRGLVLAKGEDDNEPINLEDFVSEKTQAERDRILETLVGSFIFQHTNDDQRTIIVDAMQRIDVKAGERVIKQGDSGDRFYVVDSGEFEVRLGRTQEEIDSTGGEVVFVYRSANGVNPSFGELALMYSKPRAASIYAVTDGILWGLDRRVFRKLLIRTNRPNLIRTLRRVEVLKVLSSNQVQRLCDMMAEVKFNTGDYIIKQYEMGDTFYIIMEGTAKVTQESMVGVEKVLLNMKENDYFGERALLNNEPRAANVVATTPCTCLHIGKAAFEEVLGPLASIIDRDRKRREQISEQGSIPPLKMLERKGITYQDELGGLQFCTTSVTGATSPCTLRTLLKADVIETSQLEAVLKEVDALKNLMLIDTVHECAAIDNLLTTYKDESSLFMLYEKAIVTDLSTLVHDITMTPSICKHVVACVASGISALHKAGVLYRAVAADMLFVDNNGLIVLHDFRFSKFDVEGYTMCGIPEYMSPEQVSQRGHGPAADWWAVGILLYELVTGTTPFAMPSEDQTLKKIVAHPKGGELLAWKQKVVNDMASDGKDASAVEKQLKDLETLPSAGHAFMNELLNPDPTERLGGAQRGELGGIDAVKEHKFFKKGKFSWGTADGTAENPLAPWINKRMPSIQDMQALETRPFNGDQGQFEHF